MNMIKVPRQILLIVEALCCLKKRPNVSLIAFLHNIQFYTKLISNDLHTNSFSLIGLWFSLTQNVRLVQSP